MWLFAGDADLSLKLHVAQEYYCSNYDFPILSSSIYQTNHSTNEGVCFFIFSFGVKKLWKDRLGVISLSDS